jgi:N6-adenosine-specific RNA methylase IME4
MPVRPLGVARTASADMDARLHSRSPKAANLDGRSDMTEFTGGKYKVILADPPWRYEFSLSGSRRIENQYPTMTLQEIVELPVADLAADDSLLALWATTPKLPAALEVMASWGFKYTTSMVWDKLSMGMGYYTRIQHEHLLIGRRGCPGAPPANTRCRSVIASRRRAHSEKPDKVYQIIEEWYPDARRIELFARRRRPGWDAWGNEIPPAP